MKVIRSNLEVYLYAALRDARAVDSRIGNDFKSIHTAAIEDTLKAIQDGEQLEIVD